MQGIGQLADLSVIAASDRIEPWGQCGDSGMGGTVEVSPPGHVCEGPGVGIAVSVGMRIALLRVADEVTLGTPGSFSASNFLDLKFQSGQVTDVIVVSR